MTRRLHADVIYGGFGMGQSPHILTIGGVQIAELSWVHRKREQYQLLDGRLAQRPVAGVRPSVRFGYVPLSAGSLQAYAQTYACQPERFVFLPTIHRRIPVRDAVAALQSSDIAAFSAYVWNINISLEIAKALKASKPNTLVVFGGPQVPDDAEQFLRENPEIDIACHGEGERTFLQILETAEGREWTITPGISYLDQARNFHFNPRLPRLMDLSDLPSPYLAGVFDSLIEADPDYQWQVLWETNRGCPFSCTFCDWGSAVGSKVARFDIERIHAEIDWFVAHRISNIFICDANFGLLPRDVDIARYLVKRCETANLPLAISIQNTKNATERAYQIQKALATSKLVTFGVTLSMQSVSHETLRAIKRDNISLDSFGELHSRYRNDGIETYSDLIVGLPGETYNSFTNGLSQLIDQGQHHRVAFYNCSVLPNAEMGSPRYQAEYGIEYVPVGIIREHQGLDQREREEVPEYLNIVVSTNTMSREDWARTRTFAWFTDLLHFNRVLQVVLVVLHETSGVSYRHLIEAVMEADSERYPTCAMLAALFSDHARSIQQGNPEFIPSQEYLNIWWPADQFALIKLVRENSLDAFYDEALGIFSEFLRSRGIEIDPRLLEDAIALNRGMLRIPIQLDDLEVTLSHNLLEFYEGVINGQPVALDRLHSHYRIDRTSTLWLTEDAWCEDVVVQVYRRSSFLYQASRVEVVPEAVPGLRPEAESEGMGSVQ